MLHCLDDLNRVKEFAWADGFQKLILNKMGDAHEAAMNKICGVKALAKRNYKSNLEGKCFIYGCSVALSILLSLIPHCEEEWLLSGLESSTKVVEGGEPEEEEEEERQEKKKEKDNEETGEIPDFLEGAGTELDEERLLGNSEKELKRIPTFQEVFDRTHKKKGTNQYISDRAREVAESYSQQMTEKYAGEDKQPQLDPEVWVAASGAPKKGHVYGFGHSINTSRVLSGASSSASQTSAFNAGVGTPGTSPSDMMGFIANTISGLESRLVQMHTQVTDALQAQLSQTLSQVISHALSQVSIPPQAAPSTSAHAPHVSSSDGMGGDENADEHDDDDS
ncbi:hypothetical protein Taro_017937 [Colocasia esculenta]|uniref:Uncharacterized protein n=1 Tax=Colocasia esculenta TaxID=4460 RepID=A0A843UPK5_COLES|nr:hypothetical protein [Colocasia esculenta]